jgi:hypothetical protein
LKNQNKEKWRNFEKDVNIGIEDDDKIGTNWRNCNPKMAQTRQTGQLADKFS